MADDVQIRVSATNVTQTGFQSVSKDMDSLGAKSTSMSGFLKDAFSNPMDAAKQLSGLVGGPLTSSLGTAGVAALGVASAGAVVVGVLFELVSNAAAVGAELDDMADTTGMSVPALSRMSNAAAVLGVDLGSLTNIVFMLERKMGEGGDAFEKGLSKMGLSTEQLKAAGPDRYLELVTAGLQRIADPSERAAAGNAVLGKSYRDVAATLNDLGTAMELTSDIEPWTAEQAASAEHFEMQMKSLKLHVMNVATEIGRDLIPAFSFLIGVVDRTAVGLVHIIDLGGLVSGSYRMIKGALGETALAAETAGAKQDVINRALSLGAPAGIEFADAVTFINNAFRGYIETAPDATQALSDWNKKLDDNYAKQQQQKALADALRSAPGSIPGNTFDAAADEKATQRATEAKKKLNEEAKKQLEAWEALNTSSQTLDGTLAGEIRRWLELGKSQSDIAAAYGTTAAAVKTVADQMQLESAAAKNMVDFESAAFKRRLDIERLLTAELATQLAARNALVIQANAVRFAAQQKADDDSAKINLSKFDQERRQINIWAQDQIALANGNAAALEQIGRATVGALEQVDAQEKDFFRSQDDAVKQSTNVLGGLADMFVRLGQASGGAMGGILRDVGQMVVALQNWQKEKDAGHGSFGVANALFDQGASKGDKMASAAASAGAVAQGVKDIWNATESHATRAGNAMGGMLAGAKMGAMFGPWGMAIGAAAGLVVGLVRGKPDWAKAADEVGRDFGVKISGALAKEIAKSAKTDFGGNRQAAELNALSKIISEAGGLSEKNLPQMTARLHDVFSMIETHQMTIEQGTKVLDENWQAFTQAGTDSLGLLDAKLVDIIKLQWQFGTQSKAVSDYVRGQMDTVATGFNGVAKAIVGPMKDALSTLSPDAQADTQEAFERTGRLAVIAFSAAMSSGKGFLASIQSIGPGLDVIAGAMEKVGLTGSSTLMQLLEFRKFSETNADLMAGVDGLNQMLAGLANTGMLDQAAFDDLSASADDMFFKMVAGGLTSNQAMVAMQPTLQMLWQLHKDNGLAIDDATQGILDQAEANGIVGAQMQDTNKQMLDVLKAIAKVLGADLPTAFDTTRTAASRVTTEIGHIKGAIDGVPSDKSITFHINYDDPGFVPPDPDPDMPRHAAGGVFSRPHRAWIAEGGEPEIVGSERFMARAIAGAQAFTGGAGFDGGAIVAELRAMRQENQTLLAALAQRGNVNVLLHEGPTRVVSDNEFADQAQRVLGAKMVRIPADAVMPQWR